MNKPDARALPDESLQLLRAQAHRLRRSGLTRGEIARMVGVNISTMVSWVRRFAIDKIVPDELISKKRGRRLGEKLRLSLVDESLLRDKIVGAILHSCLCRLRGRAVRRFKRLSTQQSRPLPVFVAVPGVLTGSGPGAVLKACLNDSIRTESRRVHWRWRRQLKSRADCAQSWRGRRSPWPANHLAAAVPRTARRPSPHPPNRSARNRCTLGSSGPV